MCVILTTNETSIDDPTLIDKESILCSLNIKTMSFHPGLTDHSQPPPTYSQAGKRPLTAIDSKLFLLFLRLNIYRNIYFYQRI